MISWALIFPVHKKWKWSFQWNVFWAKWFPFGNDFLANDFHLEMSFEKWLTSKKTSFLDFFGWRKWLRPVRNDLRKVWKWFSTKENDFKGTQKWLPPKWFLWDVAERIQDLIYSWEKKHFQGKLLFPEMDGNHFFHGNASQPPIIFQWSRQRITS